MDELRIVFLEAGPHVVISSALVSIPTERHVGNDTIYGVAAYTALEVRKATEEEVDAWRNEQR